MDTGYDTVFIGSRTDQYGDHEGWSGYKPSDIAISLDAWLMQNLPETVLLHIGTNGMDTLGVAAQASGVVPSMITSTNSGFRQSILKLAMYKRIFGRVFINIYP